MKKNILIVDDSDFDRKLLTSALQKKGNFQINLATQSEECLQKIKSEKIDLILMDIMMPGVHGTELLIKIREKFNPIELPIIMVTSRDDTQDVVKCLQEGANDYITKPVNFDVAMSRISTHLTLAQTSKEMAKLREIGALNAMIATYNHEINNPLAIALACAKPTTLSKEGNVTKLENALWRIADIVKKIEGATEKNSLQYEDYSEKNKMVKIK